MVAAPWPSTLVGDPTKARNSLCEWQNPQEHLLILHCLPKLLSLVLGRLSLRILHLLKSWQLRSVLLPLTKENQSSLVKLLLTRELIFEPLSSSCSTIILGWNPGCQGMVRWEGMCRESLCESNRFLSCTLIFWCCWWSDQIIIWTFDSSMNPFYQYQILVPRFRPKGSGCSCYWILMRTSDPTNPAIARLKKSRPN